MDRVNILGVGVDALSLSTEGDLVEEIMRFAMIRRRRRQHPALGGGAVGSGGTIRPTRRAARADGGWNVVHLG